MESVSREIAINAAVAADPPTATQPTMIATSWRMETRVARIVRRYPSRPCPIGSHIRAPPVP
ncbi:hypothetical protein ASD13_11705 [Microbacterium sp. Root1433D1]|nr:hypothetical protein ASD13_11705 [Microbacterium sp. Root1433D1]